MWRDVENVCGNAGLWLWCRLSILSIHQTWYRLSHLTELECWAVLYHRICQAWAGGGNFACSCQAVEREVWQQKLWEQLLSGTWNCVSIPLQGKASLVTNWPVWLCLEANYGYVYISDLACIWLKYPSHPPKSFSGCLAVVQVSEQSGCKSPELSHWDHTRTSGLGVFPFNYLHERYCYL